MGIDRDDRQTDRQTDRPVYYFPNVFIAIPRYWSFRSGRARGHPIMMDSWTVASHYCTGDWSYYPIQVPCKIPKI
jgi:hypothetical protein